jgi:hypothetical protein
MTISCPEGTLIKIYSANFGRTDNRICGNPDKNVNDVRRIDCLKSVAPKLIHCNDRLSCGITGIYNTIFGEDPCPGTWKYLDVYYYCV